jgi:hypothetical protein
MASEVTCWPKKWSGGQIFQSHERLVLTSSQKKMSGGQIFQSHKRWSENDLWSVAVPRNNSPISENEWVVGACPTKQTSDDEEPRWSISDDLMINVSHAVTALWLMHHVQIFLIACTETYDCMICSITPIAAIMRCSVRSIAVSWLTQCWQMRDGCTTIRTETWDRWFCFARSWFEISKPVQWKTKIWLKDPNKSCQVHRVVDYQSSSTTASSHFFNPFPSNLVVYLSSFHATFTVTVQQDCLERCWKRYCQNPSSTTDACQQQKGSPEIQLVWPEHPKKVTVAVGNGVWTTTVGGTRRRSLRQICQTNTRFQMTHSFENADTVFFLETLKSNTGSVILSLARTSQNSWVILIACACPIHFQSVFTWMHWHTCFASACAERHNDIIFVRVWNWTVLSNRYVVSIMFVVLHSRYILTLCVICAFLLLAVSWRCPSFIWDTPRVCRLPLPAA